VQLIETSCISGHFSEWWGSAYINIFSCKKFSAQKAKVFTAKFFRAKKVKARIIAR
jgi:S-adenosylmethionine/arginine decarboxylase-like enzyme